MLAELKAIQEVKAKGAIPLCGKCRQEAELALYCLGGKFHGVACKRCWAAHLDMIQAALIFQASGMGLKPLCSRCGDDHPTDDHIQAQEI